MSEIQLEVGKSYEVRDVELVASRSLAYHQTITKHLGLDAKLGYRFETDLGRLYKSNGRMFTNDECALDLVKEVAA